MGVGRCRHAKLLNERVFPQNRGKLRDCRQMKRKVTISTPCFPCGEHVKGKISLPADIMTAPWMSGRRKLLNCLETIRGMLKLKKNHMYGSAWTISCQGYPNGTLVSHCVPLKPALHLQWPYWEKSTMHVPPPLAPLHPPSFPAQKPKPFTVPLLPEAMMYRRKKNQAGVVFVLLSLSLVFVFACEAQISSTIRYSIM